MIISRVTHKATLEKGYINNGRIEIDELEDKDFESQIVLKFGLSPVHF